MSDILNKAITYILQHGINFVYAILIFAIGKWAARLISTIAITAMKKTKLDATLASFLKNLIYYALLAFVCIAALNKIGIETTSLIAILGAAGLAVGLALQGSLANFAAGILIIILKPFKVGDFIEAGGTIGSVEEIQIFSTVLNHPDNRRVTVPNAKITGDIISNFTAIDRRRIDLVFGISYTDDMKKAKEALQKVVANDTRVLKDPAPVIAVSELGDSSVNLVCRPWVKPCDYWAVYFDTLENGKIELEKNGITIPFPQRDVHVYQEKK